MADFHEPGIYRSGRSCLIRGTCFVAHRLEVIAGAGLLWILWCVFGGVFGGPEFSCFGCCFFLRTHSACCKYEAALRHITLY